MSDFLFPPAPPVAAPIRGRADAFPSAASSASDATTKRTRRKWAPLPIARRRSISRRRPSTRAVRLDGALSAGHEELSLRDGTRRRDRHGGFRISEAQALDHVFGYACGLDMTRRDLQAVAKEKQRPWDIAKDSNSRRCSARSRRRRRLATSIVGGSTGVNGETSQSADSRCSSTASPRSSRICRSTTTCNRRSDLHRHAGRRRTG